jgi:hypothetical protein
MSTAGSLAAALLATLSRPAWWAMALAGFLVRGGVLVILLPIVRLPTAAGLANDLAPTLVGFVLGGPSVAFVLLVATVVAATLAWLVAGGLIGGWLDLALVREAALDEELEGVPSADSGDAVRAFLARGAAHLPTAAIVTWGAVRLVDATYQELINPGDSSLPVPVRVAFRIPEVVGLLVGAWVLGEAVGGLAVRHLAWGASVPRALARAARALARPSTLATLVLTNGVLAAAILGSATAAGIAWEHLRVVLLDGGTGAEARLALVVFSLTWVAAAWFLALAATWRATAWTFEVARHLPARTIGSDSA